ncbi:MAG: 2-phosphosulfolactate phosphatase [Bacillota bacterium]
MVIEVFGVHNHVINKDLRYTQAVVIDTLRATSVMITALSNGCLQVVPTIEIDEAMQCKRTMPEHRVLLGGERNAVLIPGFDLSNSPREYTREMVEGKVLVLTTTNGTAAIHRAASSKRVLIGAMLNASAVARRLMEDGDHATIICSGTRQKFSLDDIFTAGCIISKLREMGAEIQLDDLGLTSEMLYLQYKNDWRALVQNASHYRILVDCGYADDIAYCMQEDVVDIVPEWVDGIVVK